jgi:hypothetical protein
MTNRELDCLIIGFSVGALASLWVGYWLRKRVERWNTRRQQRAARRYAKHIPFGDLSSVPRSEQDARRVIRRSDVMPLRKRDSEHPTLRRTRTPMERVAIPIVKPTNESPHVIATEIPSLPYAANIVTTSTIRMDAIAAITSVGYKHQIAETALDACTLVERAGGLESWIAAALRRLVATKP